MIKGLDPPYSSWNPSHPALRQIGSRLSPLEVAIILLYLKVLVQLPEAFSSFQRTKCVGGRD